MDSPTVVVSSKFSHQYCSNGTVGTEMAGSREAKVARLSIIFVLSVAAVA